MVRRLFPLECLAPLGLLAITACGFEPTDSGTMRATYQPPLTARQWSIIGEIAAVCHMTSGRNGLEMLQTPKGVQWRSTKPWEPGNVTELRMNGHRYQTADSTFGKDDASAMLGDFKTGAVAYLEWSNVRVGRRARILSTEIANAGFAEQYDACAARAGLTGAAR